MSGKTAATLVGKMLLRAVVPGGPIKQGKVGPTSIGASRHNLELNRLTKSPAAAQLAAVEARKPAGRSIPTHAAPSPPAIDPREPRLPTMSSLRTTASAARLLRTASHARTTLLPAARRYESSSAPVPAKTEQQKKETSPMATLPRNAPDYSVPIDMATSYELLLPR